MENKFINFSNHPSINWTTHQLNEAKNIGAVMDIPFPTVSERSSSTEILALANLYLQKVQQISEGIPCTVHIMGEMTFTYAMVNLLKTHGYTCVASTSKRIVEELPDGSKNVKFEFCQFREY